MEKVRLTVDELRVQSFATTHPEPRERGTVRANAATDYAECGTDAYSCLCGSTDGVACPSCHGDPSTCWNTCRETCETCQDCQAMSFVGVDPSLC